MNIQEYLTDMKNIQKNILYFLETETEQELNFQNLIDFFDERVIIEHKHELKSTLYLISKISQNHHRGPDFFSKIERIIKHFKENIKKFFTNSEIFNIFKNDKRILLFLFEEKIIEMNGYIVKVMTKTNKYIKANYPEYFSPEIKLFEKDEIKLSENFYNNRKIGENEKIICELIRKDMSSDFVAYIHRTNYSSNATIESSIYETNSFLYNKKPTLIEYATFFGSIEVFKYLRYQQAEMNSSLWIYAIHSQNAEIIHILEECFIELPEVLNLKDKYIYDENNNNNNNEEEEEEEDNINKKSQNLCNEILIESIKCHHLNFTTYFQNFLQFEEDHQNDDIKSIAPYCFHYYNFNFFPDELDNIYILYYACRYDYYQIVEHLLNEGRIDPNTKNISYSIYFKNRISKLIL